MKKHFITLLLLCSCLFCFTQTVNTITPLQKLKLYIEVLKKDPELKHASWGVMVQNAKTGEVIVDHNSEATLTPASSLKVVTTAAGLCILDSGYTYLTKLEYDGTFDSISGILKGNLYIKGSGDPTIDSQYFKEQARGKKDTISTLNKWAKALKTKGVKSIDGSIIADASAFDDDMIPTTWIWGDIGNYYGAGASALTYHDNLYSLYFRSESSGDSTFIDSIKPTLPNFTIKNYVKAGGSDDNAYIFGAPYVNERYVNGTIPASKKGFDVNGSIPDPPYFMAYQLEQTLKHEGIYVSKQATTVRQLKLNNEYKPGLRQTLYVHTSPPLKKIVNWTNLISNNLFAEHVLKTIAFNKTGFGSEAVGINEVVKFWSSKGMDTKGLSMYDGCGLSRYNAITSKQLSNVFYLMTKEKMYPAFYNSLPVAGKSGTMSNLCKGTCAENNIHAKSGSISKVRSFAGYATTKKGNQVCFALLFNNFDCSSSEMKQKLEKLMVMIAELE